MKILQLLEEIKRFIIMIIVAGQYFQNILINKIIMNLFL